MIPSFTDPVISCTKNFVANSKIGQQFYCFGVYFGSLIVWVQCTMYNYVHCIIALYKYKYCTMCGILPEADCRSSLPDQPRIPGIFLLKNSKITMGNYLGL